MSEKKKAKVSPPGKLGIPIPERLEDARVQFEIPDACFEVEATYGRVLLYQVSMHEGETFGETGIIMSEMQQDRETRQSPKGVIVSAGLVARDYLVANGMDVGSVVSVVRLGPYFIPIRPEGADVIELRLFDVGDIVCSYELPWCRAEKLVETVVEKDADGSPHHVLKWSDDVGIPSYRAIRPNHGDEY